MPSRRLRIVATAIAAGLVLVLAGGVVVTAVTIRKPLPQTSGTLELSGLDAEVQVVRDAQGVPSITAGTTDDLFRAQGFVAAQDRFFEMDYRRHVTSGRVSELVGANEDALAADSVIRTFGWRDVAEQEWELLLPETRSYLEAYAEGVNAYLDSRSPDALGVEYTVLGLQVDVADPEPWDPIDSVAWLKAMAWDLRGNYDDELARATTFAAVRDVARVNELFPAYPQDRNAPILPELTDESLRATATADDGAAGLGPDLASEELQRALASAQDALAAVPQLVGRGEGIGSNSWVVGGEHTASGQPILANDPHLGISAPSVWSQVGLRCADVGPQCPFDVTGFSFAGFPGVIIGHNEQLAWGLTNLGADVTDFFLERISGEQYLLDGERIDLETRTETIKVNGGDDVELVVRSTGHGPIISGVLPEVNAARVAPLPEGAPAGVYEISLGWTALAPGRSADAVFAINLARDADDIAAAAALFEVPSQNIVFATTDGHIGYQAPGKIPIRAQVPGSPVPSDGSWPRPGWDSAFDWQGFVDPADMPAVLDPEEGFIVAANQAVTRPGVGPFLTSDYDYGYRAQRIRDVLSAATEAGTKIDVASTQALQLDDANPYAEMLVRTLMTTRLESEFDRAGQRLLRDWDRRSTTDSAAAAYFAAVWSNLLELTFWDDFPESYRPTGGSRWLEVVRGLLERPDDPWWDDRTTVGVVEGRDEILTRALTSARLELTVEISKDPSDWSWGKLHTAAPEHSVLGGEGVPSAIRTLMNPGAVAVPGGSAMVNAMNWDAGTDSYAVTSAPSMRMVVDLADLDASTWVNLTGVSGHPASTHYADQLDDWAQGRTFAWPFSPAAVDEAARDRLTLRP
ncbi:penicillin acylase family protein [Cellulomonas fimi]|uniref:penicillin acylase family protein n=1 Tax=Cellulomonas fimi TaxID=1708 RepID=UPI002892CE15|nr:penicillin acylase family protein [Cellulomonas fimi]